MKYLAGLAKHGFQVRLSASGRLQIPRNTPDVVRRNIKAHLPAILAELKAEACAGQDTWWLSDPRPDLEKDSELWRILLGLAGDTDLGGALHGFRCVGAQLNKTVTGYAIGYCPGEWWTNDKQFRADYQKWLLSDDSFVGRLDAPITGLLRELTIRAAVPEQMKCKKCARRMK